MDVRRRVANGVVAAGPVVSTALAVALVATPAAHGADFLDRWLAQDLATGDWGGERTELRKRGFDLRVNDTTDNLGNPIGGRSQAFAYAGMGYGTATFDCDEIAGFEGLSLVAAGAWTSGRDLSADDIGNLFAVAQVFNGDASRRAQFYVQQNFFHGQLSGAVGRLSAGDDFAAAASYAYYVNSAVNSNPTGILNNAPSYTTPPFVQWGARAVLQPVAGIDVSVGVYNADPEQQKDRFNGIDWTLDPEDGVLTMGEVGYRPTIGSGGHGLAGRYSIGAYHDSSDYPFLSDPTRSRSGNYGLYATSESIHRWAWWFAMLTDLDRRDRDPAHRDRRRRLVRMGHQARPYAAVMGT